MIVVTPTDTSNNHHIRATATTTMAKGITLQAEGVSTPTTMPDTPGPNAEAITCSAVKCAAGEAMTGSPEDTTVAAEAATIEAAVVATTAETVEAWAGAAEAVTVSSATKACLKTTASTKTR